MYDYEQDRDWPWRWHVIVCPDPTQPFSILKLKIRARNEERFKKKLDKKLIEYTQPEYAQTYSLTPTDKDSNVPF